MFASSDPVLQLWQFLPVGYVLSVLVELPILLAGLSARHPLSVRLFAGIWLTACTYPIVILVLPLLLELPYSRSLYLAVAEPFAVVSECGLFWWAFGRSGRSGSGPFWQDTSTILLANLASFLVGEVLFLKLR